MEDQQLSQLEELAKAATTGPWRWEMNLKHKNINLCGGRPTFDKTVMDFGRWGMSGAAPRFAVKGCMTDAKELGAVVEGRAHHSDWFQDVNHPDAQYIAAFNPTTTLSLIAEIRRLRAATPSVGEEGGLTDKELKAIEEYEEAEDSGDGVGFTDIALATVPTIIRAAKRLAAISQGQSLTRPATPSLPVEGERSDNYKALHARIAVLEADIERNVTRLKEVDGVRDIIEILGRNEASEYDTELDMLVGEIQRLEAAALCAPSPSLLVEKQEEWIRVEDRLPEEAYKDTDYSNRVLALGKEPVDGDAFVAYYSTSLQLWFLAHDSQPVMKNVTHWMPLPTAPKQKGTEDAS